MLICNDPDIKNIPDFSKFAQDFVEATSPLIGGRMINIMNCEGTIIASTDKTRIGTFHTGAAQVLKTGQPVLVRPENVSDYPGAREGYNMPIFQHDSLIGVVGIFGTEREVQDTAKLLGVYVSQHFAQYVFAQKQTMESELRTQLLRLLLLGDTAQIEIITQLSDILNIHIVFPIKVLLIYSQEDNQQKQMQNYSYFIHYLLWHGIMSRSTDLFGIQKNGYIILLGNSTDSTRLQKLKHIITAGDTYFLAVSSMCHTITDIARGMREVSILRELEKEVIQDIEENGTQVNYLFHKLLLHGGREYAERKYGLLLQQESPQQADILLKTAQVYYEQQSSIATAAEMLHIHKNTLLYRIKQLYRLLGIEHESAFIREFLIQLILKIGN